MRGVATVLALRNQYGRPQADFSNLNDFVDPSYYEGALRSLEAD